MSEEMIQSQQIFKGRLLTVRRDIVRLPSGNESVREVVEHPGAIAILPVLENGNLVLVRQFRYAVGRALLEVPAGTREPGEADIEVAHRELHEEVGFRGDLEELLRFYISPGWCNEQLIAYRATNLTSVGAQPDEDENLEIVEVRPDEVGGLIASGEIADAKTVTAILAHLARPSA